MYNSPGNRTASIIDRVTRTWSADDPTDGRADERTSAPCVSIVFRLTYRNESGGKNEAGEMRYCRRDHYGTDRHSCAGVLLTGDYQWCGLPALCAARARPTC